MKTGRVSVGHPVDVAKGTVYSTHKDISIPGKVDLIWERRYSTALLSSPPSPLGPGWTTRYFSGLSYADGEYRFVTPDGELEIFADPNGEVERGKVIRNFGTFQEITCSGSRYIITQWDVDSGEIERFVFVRGKPGTIWPLAALEDVTGQGLDLLYDGRGRLSGIRQRLEKRTLLLEYTSGDRIKSVVFQAAGGEKYTLARYEYDAHGRLVAAHDALKNTDTYEYDEKSQMTGEFVKDGGAFYFIYDEQGRCLKTAGLDGYDEKTFRYLDQQGWTEVTDSRGHVWRYQYNGAGQVITEVDPLGAEEKTEFDELGRITAQIDGNGATTKYEYDEHGNRAGTIDPFGNESLLVFNDAHLPLSLTDPNGNLWKRQFDGENRLVVNEDPLGGRRKYTYDAYGNMIAATDPKGAVMRHAYSAQGILMERTDWQGNATRYATDDMGRVVKRIGSLNDVTLFRYDANGNLTEIEFSDNSIVRGSYDPGGNLASFTDENGNVTKYHYGPCGRLLKRTDAAGHTVEYHWAAEPYNLDRVINERGETYSFAYDPAGRLIREEGFDGRVQTFEYDAADNCIAVINGLGEKISFDVDPAGNLVEEKLPDGSSAKYAYDKFGNLIAAINNNSTVEFKRDALGRVIGETQGKFTVESEYDAVDNLVRSKTSLGYEAAFSFDANGKMWRCALPNGDSMEFERNARGEEICRRLPGGIMFTQDHNAVGQVVGQRVDVHPPDKHNPGSLTPDGRSILPTADPLLRREFQYDKTGALTLIKDGLWGTETFVYDPTQRLIRAFREHGSSEQFAYDGAGNMTSHVIGEETIEAKYGPGSRLLARGSMRFYYDDNGRLISKTENADSDRPQEWHYSWSADDRLQSVIRPDGEEWRYTYDALGRRITKTCKKKTIHFFWDRNVIVHQVEDSLPPVTWVYEHDSFIPLCKIEKGEIYPVIVDHLGTPRELLDKKGNIVWSASFRSWGEVDEHRENRIDCPLRFQGQWFDGESGLYYNRFRYYDPFIGRYISLDPIGLLGGLNLYLYARNPINWFDPLGLNSCDKKKEKELKKKRQAGVKAMWANESENIKNGRPSRKWTPQQEKDILAGKIPKSDIDGKPIEGAHIQSVKDHPELADNPDNIVPKSYTEHRKKDSGEHSTNPKNWDISPNTTP